MEAYAIEGPAGSGKTTIIKEVANKVKGEIWDPQLLRPRDYGGPGLSLVRDATQVQRMLTADIPVVFDRFWLSAWVYDQLRDKDGSYPSISVHLGHLWELLRWTKKYLQQRGFSFVNVDTHLTYIFCMPDFSTLIKQRSETGKEYPFSADSELAMYRQAYHELEKVQGMFGQDFRITLTAVESWNIT
ncbi:MAG: hypothetical protein QQN63_00885 [Nitrosopumilus sp.]